MGALMPAGVDTKGDLKREEILRIKAILDTQNFKVNVGDNWTDDHEACCDFEVVGVNRESASFSLWWIDPRVMGWAEACEDSPKIRAKFCEYMSSSIQNALDDLEE